MRERARKQGDNAESSFRTYAESLGFGVKQSSLETDRKHHIDFVIDKNGGCYTVDVKSCKRIGGEERDDLVWVEIQCEYPQNKPWLFAPLMSHVAFEQTDGSFLVVPRLAIVKVVRENFSEATTVTDNIKTLLSDPKKYAYRRSHMKREKCLLVSTDLLKPFAIDLKPETQPKITSFFKSSPIAAVNRDILIGPTAV